MSPRISLGQAMVRQASELNRHYPRLTYTNALLNNLCHTLCYKLTDITRLAVATEKY